MLTSGGSMAGNSRTMEEIERELREAKAMSGLGGADPKALRLASERQTLINKMGGVEPLQMDLSSQAQQSNVAGNLGKAQAGMEIAKAAGVIGDSPTSTTGGVASGTISGAATGAMVGGVPGALIGGALGGTLGALKAKSARRRARAEAEAEMQQNLGKIESSKALRMQEALSSMAANIGNTLRSV